MAKTDNIRQFFGKNEKICRNLLFGRNLFVYLHRIVCLSCTIGEMDGTKLYNCSIPRRTATSTTEKTSKNYHIGVAHYAQTSTYVIMGCCRPVWEYGGVCAIFMSI